MERTRMMSLSVRNVLVLAYCDLNRVIVAVQARRRTNGRMDFADDEELRFSPLTKIPRSCDSGRFNIDDSNMLPKKI